MVRDICHRSYTNARITLELEYQQREMFVDGWRVTVKFDANTKVGTLYRALPSAAPVLHRFEISVDADGDLTLQQIAERRKFSLEELMQNLENFQWDEESASS